MHPIHVIIFVAGFLVGFGLIQLKNQLTENVIRVGAADESGGRPVSLSFGIPLEEVIKRNHITFKIIRD